MFEKLLIADRGEPVLRIARTCERLGIVSVAVHAEGEASHSHVTACDEAVALGASDANNPYQDAAAVVAAAKQAGVQAVHPGYNQLGQDPAFARAVAEAGLVLVGPSPDALECFGDLLRGRDVARAAGVRALAGARVDLGDLSAALAAAQDVPYPLRIQSADPDIEEAVAGEGELEDALLTCLERLRRASLPLTVLIEHAIERPRLLAVMVLADGRGKYAALLDFEHSLHRQGLTLLAESPAPAWASLPGGAQRRQALYESATIIAKEAGIAGTATAEFLIDTRGQIHFSRLRLGLPAEHALWEMCTGLDLVEAQLRLASGEALPAEIGRQPSGNAAEAHIYAELPPNHARTEPFDIKALRWPVVAPGALRIETDLAVGARAGTNYDLLVGKVLAYGQSRHQALLTLDRVLAEATIDPLPTNLPFLREILGDESFRAGQYDSDFAQRLLAELRAAPR